MQKGTIHCKFVSEGQTVNGKFYSNIMKHLLARIYCFRPELSKDDGWFLLHEDASAHSSGLVSQYLAKRKVWMLSHPHTNRI